MEIYTHDRSDSRSWWSITGSQHEENFMGNFGFIRPYRDYELIRLDEWDQNEYSIEIESLKEDERIFRYENDTTRISGMRPLVKVNIKRGLVYFLTEESFNGDVDRAEFRSRGMKVEWLHIILD